MTNYTVYDLIKFNNIKGLISILLNSDNALLVDTINVAVQDFTNGKLSIDELVVIVEYNQPIQ